MVPACRAPTNSALRVSRASISRKSPPSWRRADAYQLSTRVGAALRQASSWTIFSCGAAAMHKEFTVGLLVEGRWQDRWYETEQHGGRFVRADIAFRAWVTADGRCDYLHQIYSLAQPRYCGRVTVPVLFDKETGTIVNNESAEIIEMLNSAFDAYGDATVNFFPAERCAEMDALNAEIYTHINNGVYRAGFATRQAAYEEATTACSHCSTR